MRVLTSDYFRETQLFALKSHVEKQFARLTLSPSLSVFNSNLAICLLSRIDTAIIFGVLILQLREILSEILFAIYLNKKILYI